MKISILVIIAVLLVGLPALSRETYTAKEQIVNLSLDLQESRRREEILGKAIKDLSYQVDIMATTLKGK